jgi:hypothetical protein
MEQNGPESGNVEQIEEWDGAKREAEWEQDEADGPDWMKQNGEQKEEQHGAGWSRQSRME